MLQILIDKASNLIPSQPNHTTPKERPSQISKTNTEVFWWVYRFGHSRTFLKSYGPSCHGLFLCMLYYFRTDGSECLTEYTANAQSTCDKRGCEHATWGSRCLRKWNHGKNSISLHCSSESTWKFTKIPSTQVKRGRSVQRRQTSTTRLDCEEARKEMGCVETEEIRSRRICDQRAHCWINEVMWLQWEWTEGKLLRHLHFDTHYNSHV